MEWPGPFLPPDSGSPRHLVRLLYNEQVLPIPGCGSGSGLDCDLDEFLELMEVREAQRERERRAGAGDFPTVVVL